MRISRWMGLHQLYSSLLYLFKFNMKAIMHLSMLRGGVGAGKGGRFEFRSSFQFKCLTEECKFSIPGILVLFKRMHILHFYLGKSIGLSKKELKIKKL